MEENKEPSDKTVKDPQSIPAEESSKKINISEEPAKTIVIVQEKPEENITNPEKEKMEVHHHPDLHHKKKHLKEYFLEFIMIFLAVTLGFIAENLREGRADHSKETEYIKSMVEDAETDITNYDMAIAENEMRINSLDTLAKICFAFNPKDTCSTAIYTVFRKCLRHPDLVSPVERTMMQLKNSGGMRLIESRVAADSIILYDDFGKKLLEQQMAYEQYLSKMLDKSTDVINFNYYENNTYQKRATKIFAFDTSPKLIEPNKTKLVEFGNVVTLYQEIVVFYMVRLNEGKQHAFDLIKTLKKEYKLG